MYCILYMQHKKKNKFATEEAINTSKKLAIREHTNTEDHNDAEKLEKARIQIESLQIQLLSSNVNTNHIIIRKFFKGINIDKNHIIISSIKIALVEYNRYRYNNRIY